MEARGKNGGEVNGKEEHYETASHPCKCCEVMLLTYQGIKGTVVTVCGIIDTGCTRSIIQKTR